jgi:hypothetical protein
VRTWAHARIFGTTQADLKALRRLTSVTAESSPAGAACRVPGDSCFCARPSGSSWLPSSLHLELRLETAGGTALPSARCALPDVLSRQQARLFDHAEELDANGPRYLAPSAVFGRARLPRAKPCSDREGLILFGQHGPGPKSRNRQQHDRAHKMGTATSPHSQPQCSWKAARASARNARNSSGATSKTMSSAHTAARSHPVGGKAIAQIARHTNETTSGPNA